MTSSTQFLAGLKRSSCCAFESRIDYFDLAVKPKLTGILTRKVSRELDGCVYHLHLYLERCAFDVHMSVSVVWTTAPWLAVKTTYQGSAYVSPFMQTKYEDLREQVFSAARLMDLMPERLHYEGCSIPSERFYEATFEEVKEGKIWK